MVTKKAYAKINLTLDVLGKRKNNYHEVKMIMQEVSLHDVLKFEKMSEPGIKLSVQKNMNENQSDSEVGVLPTGDDNLICRVANYMLAEYGISGGLKILLQKNIPIAAGLAGGSTDAAQTIIAINEMHNLNLSEDQLCEIGVKFGADIPFCIMGGTMLSEGIGERLLRIPSMPPCEILIVKPDAFISTADAYNGLGYVYPEGYIGDISTKRISDIKITHPNSDMMISAFKTGDLDIATSYMGNVLEDVSINEHPEIKKIKNDMMSLGAINAMMSGSGPSVYGIFPHGFELGAAIKHFENEGIPEIHACNPVSVCNIEILTKHVYADPETGDISHTDESSVSGTGEIILSGGAARVSFLGDDSEEYELLFKGESADIRRGSGDKNSIYLRENAEHTTVYKTPYGNMEMTFKCDSFDVSVGRDGNFRAFNPVYTEAEGFKKRMYATAMKEGGFKVRSEYDILAGGKRASRNLNVIIVESIIR